MVHGTGTDLLHKELLVYDILHPPDSLIRRKYRYKLRNSNRRSDTLYHVKTVGTTGTQTSMTVIITIK